MMALFEYRMPEDFLLKISRLGNKTDEIVEKMLQAGAEAALPKIKASLEDVIGKGTKYDTRSTEELVDSLGISPVDINKKGNHDIKIGFNEPRKKQPKSNGNKRSYNELTNAMIASTIEYGRSNQAPKPFMKKGKGAARKECMAVMEAKFDEEIDKL